MSFARFVFVFAFLMLVAGIGISRWLLAPAFDGPPEPDVLVAAVATATITATPGPTPPPSATATPPATATPKPKPTLFPTSTPAPTPSPTSGIITLVRYWVGATRARPGQAVEIGFVIDNETGHTARILLGASLKSSRSLTWAAGVVSDPAHDVVATVPPGTSTHVRFFTLPTGLRAGAYDVAWGLRNALTGRREALVSAVGALRVS